MQATRLAESFIEREMHLSDFHTELAAHHRAQLRPSGVIARPRLLEDDFERSLQDEVAIRCGEHAFIEQERADVADLALDAPTNPPEFIEWFESLRETGPGQNDPLFPWLAAHASYEEMKYFLTQEVAGEAGFEDLVALTQVGLPTRAKLELARNYWDEMGRGHESGMHGPLLAVLAEHFEISHPRASDICWESLALGNLMFALATNRQYVWHSIGALGVIELTAPGRALSVNQGLRRLGIPGDIRRYFALHSTLDVKHSLAWNAEVIAPLVEEFPDAAQGIAEGALMRLAAGARCFRRYRESLWMMDAR